MNKSSTGSGFTVKASIKDEESESDIDDDYDLCEETSLHSSVCLVDEYNIFKAVLASMVLCPLSSILIKLANPGIQRSNPAWYGQLTRGRSCPRCRGRSCPSWSPWPTRVWLPRRESRDLTRRHN